MFNSVLNEMRDLFQNLNTSQSMLLKAIVIWCVYLLVRNIPSIITAVELVKEAKRHNYNKVVCGLFGYAFPIIAPIGFFLVVKYSERQINYSEKKGISGRTVITFFTSAIIIVISFVLAFTATAVGIGSFIRSSLTDEHLKTYYDKMGNEYHELDTTIDMYDRDWNKYVYKFDGLFDPVVYIDENGNEYDSDRCFIDSEGWFVYDYDAHLSMTKAMNNIFVIDLQTATGINIISSETLPLKWMRTEKSMLIWEKPSKNLILQIDKLR